MSKKHPVIAITGSSGAGTSTVKSAFHHIFSRLNVTPIIIEGDSFHRYDRIEMNKVMAKEEAKGNKYFSHFGPDANLFDEIEKTFKTYGEKGVCRRRYYLHNEEEAEPFAQEPGEFTSWQEMGEGSDLLFYEGLHGGVKHGDIDVSKYVDLLIGVVPVVNLEWIQKIHRDKEKRGYSAEATVDTIHRRMWDYINFITPQFSRTDINFQRVPMVDTSNPFIARDIPTLDESFVVVRFKDHKFCDFLYLQDMIKDSFMSRPNTLVVPGGKMGFVMELILREQIAKMLDK
ncbi:MAG: phosphoribulokinase [Gammaproteobacteria bacterium]